MDNGTYVESFMFHLYVDLVIDILCLLATERKNRTLFELDAAVKIKGNYIFRMLFAINNLAEEEIFKIKVT